MGIYNIGDLVRCKSKYLHSYTGIYKIESITLDRETKIRYYRCGNETQIRSNGLSYKVVVILSEEDIELVYEL